MFIPELLRKKDIPFKIEQQQEAKQEQNIS